MASGERMVSPRTQYAEEEGGGWVTFAALVLIIASIMRFFDALWAFTYKGSTPENLQNALFGHSLSTYGWLWIVVAAVLLLCGIGVAIRNQLARWIGVFGGALLAISAIWWMPYYPVWSLVYVGIGVLVVYGLVAHGQAA